MTTLLRLLTEPAYANDKTIVIVAGYEQDMAAMMSRNQGMLGRFRQTLSFEDWGEQSCVSLLGSIARKNNVAVSQEGTARLLEGFRELRGLRGWANARDVISMAERLSFHRADRVYARKEEVACFIKADVDAAVDEFVQERRKAEAAYAQAKREELMKRLGVGEGDMQQQYAPQQQQQQQQQQQHQQQQQEEAQQQQEEEHAEDDDAEEQAEAEEQEGDGGMTEAEKVADDARKAQLMDEALKQQLLEAEARRVQEALEAQTRLNEQMRLEEEAENERKRLQEEAEAAERERQRLIKEAEEAAEAERQRLLEEARRLAAEKQRLEREAREAAERARRAREAAERARRVRNESARMRAVLTIGCCAAGYGYTKVSGGYRCNAGGRARGSHFVSDSEVDSIMR